MYYALCIIVGINIGFVAAVLLISGKVQDLQMQLDTKCDGCGYRLLNHPQRERMGSVTRR